MGRIVAQVHISNYLDPEKKLECAALVDTGASHIVLPLAWRDKLGVLPEKNKVSIALANQQTTEAEICGPVRLQIEGFRAISTEVLFIEMKSENGGYEPLLGYIPLEQSQAAVDMLGHRLVHVKSLDLK